MYISFRLNLEKIVWQLHQQKKNLLDQVPGSAKKKSKHSHNINLLTFYIDKEKYSIEIEKQKL
jgi:hypothetical protein